MVDKTCEFDNNSYCNPYHTYDMLIEALYRLCVISRDELDYVDDHLYMSDLIRMFGDKAFRDG